MKKSNIILTDTRRYDVQYADPELNYLTRYLADEVGGNIEVTKELLKEQNSYIGNAYFVDLIDNHIKIGNLFSDEDPDIMFPYDKFLELLVKWKEMCKKGPKKATITMDDKYNFDIIY